MSYKQVADEKKRAVNAQIPKEWILADIPSPETHRHVDSVVLGHLTLEEQTITSLTATELVKQISKCQLTSLQVTKAFCHRAALVHQLTNCLSEIFFDRAFIEARALDDYQTEHNGDTIGPLHGLPISLKDQFHIKGIDSAIGFVGLVNKPATSESALVTILRKAGAVLYVKTTVPMAMMSGFTYSHIYGETVNSVNRLISCGGSSGGEGALIAGHGSPLGVGTDIAGSIRSPAAIQGIWGIRPTTGRLPYYMVANSMPDQPIVPSVLGPLATSEEDLELFCKVVVDSKPWTVDNKCVPVPWSPYTVDKKVLCIGVLRDNGFVHPHPPTIRALAKLEEKLKAAGHEVVAIEPLHFEEMYATLGRILEADGLDWIKRHCELSGEPILDGLIGTENGLSTLEAASVNMHWEDSRLKYHFQQRFSEYLNSLRSASGQAVDAWISPVWGECAFNMPRADFETANISYCGVQNVLDIPAVVFPIGVMSRDEPVQFPPPFNETDKRTQGYFDADLYDGTPISVQLCTRRFEDEKALAIAKAVSALSGN